MEEEQEGLELRRYLEILARWWWLILLVAALVALGAYLYSKASERTVYSASTTILIQESRGAAAPTFGDIGVSRQLAGTYEELMTTRPLLEKVAVELDQGVTASDLENMVEVSTVRNTPLLSVEASSRDPDLPIDVANTLSQVFIQDLQTKRLGEIAQLQALAAAQGVGGSGELLQAQFRTLGSLTIVESATFTSASVEPSVVRNTALGSVLGLFLGVVGVFLLEYLNRSIRSAEQIERMFGLANLRASALGVVHKWRPKEVAPEGLVMENDSKSVYAEMFRQVRTGFQFASAASSGKAFLVTSATPREGKTTVTANLGAALAQGGGKVILVEGDLRRPSFHRLFHLHTNPGVNSHVGLSGLLADATSAAAPALFDVGIPRLKVLPGGAIPPNPADLLGSDRMPQIIDELVQQCDYLLVDSPPILSAADPLILASKVDGVILVTTLGETRSDDLKSAVQEIQRSEKPLLGYVLNKVGQRSFGYGRYRYHYYYYYSRESVEGEDGRGKRGRSGRGRQPSLRRRISRRLSLTSRAR